MIRDEHARLGFVGFRAGRGAHSVPTIDVETPLGAEVGEVSVYAPYCTRIFHKLLRLRRGPAGH